VQGAGYHPRYDFAGSMSLCPRRHSFRRDDRDSVIKGRMASSNFTEAEWILPKSGSLILKIRRYRYFASLGGKIFCIWM
jgi:hypothetical protein